MSVQTYRHSFEFAKAIEATVEHVVCAGQVPQIVIHYHHRATFEPNHSTSSQSRHDRTSSTGPPGLSSLAGTRIITSKFRYKLVPDSTSEDLERTLDSVSRTSTSTRYPVDNSLRHPQPVRYFTGLSTPEPTPPRLPNRSQSPRRCQSLTREGDQCSRTPAAARNVIPYGWYCRRHGRTGDLPPPNVSRSTAYETCPGPSQVPWARSSLPPLLQLSPPARPHVVPYYSSAPDSATPRTHLSSSRPAQMPPTPSPEPQPPTTLFSERPRSESSQDPLAQLAASHARPSSPLRPLRLPQILGLSPQSPTIHLADNSPDQTPAPFRRSHRASGSSSLSTLGWPITPVRQGARRESSGTSTSEPAQDRLKSPGLPFAPSPVPSSTRSSVSSQSPALPLVLSPISFSTQSSSESPVHTPALSPVLPLTPPPALPPVLLSELRSSVFGASPDNSFQHPRCHVDSVPLPSPNVEACVTPDSEPKEPGSLDLAKDQRKPQASRTEADIPSDISHASPGLERPDGFAIDSSIQSQVSVFESAGNIDLSRSELLSETLVVPVSSGSGRLILPLLRRAQRTAGCLSAQGTEKTSTLRLSAELSSQPEPRAKAPTSPELALSRVHSPRTPVANLLNLEPGISDLAEQHSVRPQEQALASTEGVTRASSSSSSTAHSMASIAPQPTFAAESEVIQTQTPTAKRPPFVSRLPRPSLATSHRRTSFDGPRQELQSQAPSRIPRLVAKAHQPSKLTGSIAPKVCLSTKGTNKTLSLRRSTLARCSLASTVGACPRAARRSQRSTKPIDFLIRHGPERFSDYIPEGLSSTAQNKLRRRMQKASTGSAAKGYIYALEITNMSTDDHTCIKIGRTTDPEEPLQQWRSQCPLSQVALGRVWPATANQRDHINESTPMIKYCSTLEGLVRLELEDIALYSGHIQHGKNSRNISVNSSPTQCKGCGARHNDIYTIEHHRLADGRTAWDLLDEMIQGWSTFVSQYCGDA